MVHPFRDLSLPARLRVFIKKKKPPILSGFREFHCTMGACMTFLYAFCTMERGDCTEDRPEITISNTLKPLAATRKICYSA